MWPLRGLTKPRGETGVGIIATQSIATYLGCFLGWCAAPNARVGHWKCHLSRGRVIGPPLGATRSELWATRPDSRPPVLSSKVRRQAFLGWRRHTQGARRIRGCSLVRSAAESTRFTGLEAGGLGAGVSEDGAPCGSQAVRLSNRTFGGTESPPVEPKRVHYGVEDSRQRTEFDKPTSPSPPPPPPASQPYASDPLSPPCVPRCRSNIKGLKPQEIVNFLNEHIVGQLEAKKAVANALRNRWRRQQVRNQELRDDILPKNILMIGPTGVGKTEIARRMAKIIDAPFIKVEATKYTEVGFHGRDVDTIIKDLVELALRRQYLRIEADLFPQAQRLADEKILQALAGQVSIEADKEMYENLRLGRLDNQLVTLDVPSSYASGGGPFGANNCPSSDYSSHSGLGADVNGFSQNQEFPVFSAFNGTSLWTAAGSSGRKERMEKKTMSIKEARTVLSHLEFSRLMGSVAKTRVTQQALEAVEQEGIVFVDEIDKICSSKAHSYTGPDASAEGVQRDLLPLIEGTTVTTRYGNVKTDHILFIASGAFHTVKPSDMMAELQGRLPVRVELKPLSEEDFRKILFKTRHNLLEQNIALLATEGVTLLFEPSAIWEIARSAYEVNSFVENIGARRLITIIEKVMEEISFMAPEMDAGSLLRVTEDVVRRAVEPLTAATDLHKFIL